MVSEEAESYMLRDLSNEVGLSNGIQQPSPVYDGKASSNIDNYNASLDTPGAVQKLQPTTIALILVSLGLSCLLSALDVTIVTTAVPAIVADFKSSDGYIWIGSSYILANTAMSPVWGSIADIWGRKPIFLIALTVFLIGSLLCALSPHMEAMIAGRVIQGLGSSGTSIMGSVVISDLFSLRDRGLYGSMLTIVWAVGAATGPLLGGSLTTKLKYTPPT
jgi:MFS family permease